MGSSQYVELHYSKKLLALTEEPTEQKAVQTIQNLVPNLKELGYYLSDKKYDGVTFMPKEDHVFYLRVENNVAQPKIARTIAPARVFSQSPALASVSRALRGIPLYYVCGRYATYG